MKCSTKKMACIQKYLPSHYFEQESTLRKEKLFAPVENLLAFQSIAFEIDKVAIAFFLKKLEEEPLFCRMQVFAIA